MQQINDTFIYRIKDEQTGLYYKEEFYEDIKFIQTRLSEAIKEKNKSNVEYYTRLLNRVNKASYILDTQYTNKKYLNFDEIGRFYHTKMGAEKICSGFTKCTYKDRATKAGRILKAKYNFIVVKSKVILEDIKE